MSRPEIQAPPEIFYNDDEAWKYTSSSRMIKVQAKLSERALELLDLPEDVVHRLLLDIGCGSGLSGEILSECGHHWVGLDISQSMLDVALEREAEGDLILSDMGQWLCNADKSYHDPRKRLKAFFESLYRSLSRGARAVLQVYPENDAQYELIFSSAIRAGFSGDVVVDYPHSSKSRKVYLVLTCGPPSLNSAAPQAILEDEDCSDGDNSDDEETQEVSVYDRHRPRKRQKLNDETKGRQWVLEKKEQMRRKGKDVPPDSQYTGRKRKNRF